MTTEQVWKLIEAERNYQIAKWGFNHHTHEEWTVIANEESGEVSKAILNLNASFPTQVTREALLRELVQHAAVLAAWIEDYCENTPEDEVQQLIETRNAKAAKLNTTEPQQPPA